MGVLDVMIYQGKDLYAATYLATKVKNNRNKIGSITVTRFQLQIAKSHTVTVAGTEHNNCTF